MTDGMDGRKSILNGGRFADGQTGSIDDVGILVTADTDLGGEDGRRARTIAAAADAYSDSDNERSDVVGNVLAYRADVAGANGNVGVVGEVVGGNMYLYRGMTFAVGMNADSTGSPY